MSFLLEQHFHLSVLTGFSPPTHERLCCRRRAVCLRADVHVATLTQIYHLTKMYVILRLQQPPLFYIDWCEKLKSSSEQMQCGSGWLMFSRYSVQFWKSCAH